MSQNTRCQAAGCTHDGATPCAYVDRRSQPCRTSWCRDHRQRVGDRDYCRRHATVVRALGDGHNARYPEVDNRAASLAAYLGEALDGRVTAILGSAAGSEASLVSHPVRVVTAPGSRERRWQRSWNLVDSTGVVSRVVIEVDESQDQVVMTTVGSSRIGRGTPPWIRRRDARAVAPERRAAFVDAIGRAIEMILTRPEMAPGSL
jgi:hypothetical protein